MKQVNCLKLVYSCKSGSNIHAYIHTHTHTHRRLDHPRIKRQVIAIALAGVAVSK